MTSRPSDVLETDCGLLSGYGCNERGPFLVVDRLDTTSWERHYFTPGARSFTLEARAERHCTGRHDLLTGKSSPCPLRAPLGPGQAEQCPACFVVTGFNPAFYNAAQVSEAQRRRNREPHAVYLASFGAGTIKVGMTLAARASSRLLEQGARIGAVIARCEDADHARDLEAYVAREHGVTESVRASRKRQLLLAPFDDGSARAELRARLAAIAHTRPEVDARAEILNFDAHYGQPQLFGGSATDLSETQPLAISGSCLGMIGDVLVMTQAGERFLLSVSAMVGHRIALTASERRNRFVGQLGLPF